MADAYADEYGFEPLPPALAARLDFVRGLGGEGELVEVPTLNSEYDELVASGHLAMYHEYLNGTGLVSLTARGARYREDLAAYLERRAAWEAARERASRDERAHDWRLNIVNGVVAIVAAIIGYLLGRMVP